MFNIQYTAPTTIKGHLKLKRDPFYYGIGNYEDSKGNIWNVIGIYGREFIQAVGYDSHSPYFSTAGIFSYQMRWEPYTYEIIKKE